MCSRVLWTSEGQPALIGRNWDWTDVVVTELYTTPRGIERSGMTPTNPMKWKAKYANVAAVAWEALTGGGINEAGLSVNLLYLAESDFGERDDTLKGVCCSVWAQYYLDCFATVAEAGLDLEDVQMRRAGSRTLLRVLVDRDGGVTLDEAGDLLKAAVGSPGLMTIHTEEATLENIFIQMTGRGLEG